MFNKLFTVKDDKPTGSIQTRIAVLPGKVESITLNADGTQKARIQIGSSTFDTVNVPTNALKPNDQLNVIFELK